MQLGWAWAGKPNQRLPDHNVIGRKSLGLVRFHAEGTLAYVFRVHSTDTMVEKRE